MKNYYTFLCCALCLFAWPALAQKPLIQVDINPKDHQPVSPIVKENIEKYAQRINDVIRLEKAKMESEIEKIDFQVSKNQLSLEEADQLKKETSEKYSETINEKIEKIEFDMDDVIKKQVRFSLLNSDAQTDYEEFEELRRRHSAVRSLSPYMSYGAFFLTNSEPDNDLDKNVGFSTNLELGMKLNYQFSRTSPWGFTSGLAFSWRTLRIDNNRKFSKDEHGDVFLERFDGSFKKSKLRSTYLMLPIGLQYNLSPLKTAGQNVQYRSFYSGFKIGANVYGGALLSSNNITKGNKKSGRNRENYQMAPFVYGAQLNVAHGNVAVYVRKDLNDLFRKETFNHSQLLQFGVTFGF